MTPEGDRDAPATPLGPSGAGDGGLLTGDRRPAQGTWAADELQQALARIDALTRELHQLGTVVRAQQEEVFRLSDSVQVVEGRTIRHETSQEQTREVRHEVADLEERLAQEASLRRDLAAQVERSQYREAETQHELQRVLQMIAERLDEFDQRVAAEARRHAVTRDDSSQDTREDEGLRARLEHLEHRVGAEAESNRHQGTEIARLASSITGLVSGLDAADARTRAAQQDQYRLDQDVAALRTIRSREEELLDLVEQQRATRARLEDRVSAVEEALEALRQEVRATSEERALLAREVAGEAEQRRALMERLEAQRDAVIEHTRRQARAEEEARRRMIEELERDIRVQRSLLVRLAEQTEEGEQEQPL